MRAPILVPRPRLLVAEPALSGTPCPDSTVVSRSSWFLCRSGLPRCSPATQGPRTGAPGLLCWQSMNHLTIRGIAAALVLFLGVLSAEAETFTINGKDIIIPVPEGFARVTEEMPLVRELAQQADAADKANDTLAYFIERADVRQRLRARCRSSTVLLALP